MPPIIDTAAGQRQSQGPRGSCGAHDSVAAAVKSPEVSWRQLLQLIDVGAHLKSQRSLLPWSATFRAWCAAGSSCA